MRDDEFYENSFGGLYATGFTGFLKGMFHKLIGFPFHNSRTETILEVGAEHEVHPNYVNGNFATYYMTDTFIDQDLKFNDSPEKLVVIEQAAQNLDFENDIFDRDIATCCIAHIGNPTTALGEWRRVTKDMSDITISIPCEYGVLMRLFRFVLILPKSLLKGVSKFNSLIVLKRRNSYHFVKHLMKMELKGDEVRLRRYPFPLSNWNLNASAIASIEINKG